MEMNAYIAGVAIMNKDSSVLGYDTVSLSEWPLMLGNAHSVTQRHTPENLSTQKQCCEKLNSCYIINC
jgi:hypothetical protein